MARPRTELDEKLQAIMTDVNPDYQFKTHVYFRPPSKGINYPCITYDLSAEDTQHADNIKYIHFNRYILTVVDKNPDSEIKDRVSELPHCKLDRTYQSDGLNHFVFVIYY